MQKIKNELLREFMLHNSLSQASFARGAGIDPGNFSTMLSVDMTEAQQKELIDKYKEATK